MQTAQYHNLKTVNIDSNIFNRTSPPARSKLPSKILKSLIQRKRNNQRNSSSRGERYIVNLSKTRQVVEKEQLWSQPSITDIHQPLNTVDLFTNKKHKKTNSEVENCRTFNFIEKNFRPLDQCFQNNKGLEQSLSIPLQTKQSVKCKMNKRGQKPNEQNVQNQYLRQTSGKINPYTQQQYAYLTHKERDYFCQIKKTTRFRRISSITKSYKVATIQLATPDHHYHQRRPSVYTPANKVRMISPIKRISETKKFLSRHEPQLVTPSPWQWGLQQSKEILY